MSALWWWLLAGAAACYLLKLSGYLVPQRLLDSPMLVKISSSLTIGLLASLVMANTFASGQQLALDARLASLVAAVVALRLRAPFLLVVVIGAAAAALTRLAGAQLT